MLGGQKIHFMGAGGIGVSALAHMAALAGAEVTACDRAPNDLTRFLESRGIPVAAGHAPEHVRGADLLVHTAAVPPGHPERAAAARTEARGRFLARLMDAHRAGAPAGAPRPSLGVCGTHGKTTTSWLLAQILIAAGRDPSVFIGGVAAALPFKNHRAGCGPFAAELDESDGSFLFPSLDVAVITTVESDHLSHYGTDENLFSAFRDFVRGAEGLVERSGVLVAGTDNARAREIFSAHAGRKISFALDRDADFRAADLAFDAAGASFSLAGEKAPPGRFSLPLPGRHNVANALAAIAAAAAIGVSPDDAGRALAQATAAGRRMERLGLCEGAAWYSDYAHHPTEIAAALAGLRTCHAGKILAVFQPHLFSRTRDYAPAFASALAGADTVLLVDIYPAREEPLPGVTSEIIAQGLRAAGADVHGPVPVADAASEAIRLCAGGGAGGIEAVVMMGAGDIDEAARAVDFGGSGRI